MRATGVLPLVRAIKGKTAAKKTKDGRDKASVASSPVPRPCPSDWPTSPSGPVPPVSPPKPPNPFSRLPKAAPCPSPPSRGRRERKRRLGSSVSPITPRDEQGPSLAQAKCHGVGGAATRQCGQTRNNIYPSQPAPIMHGRTSQERAQEQKGKKNAVEHAQGNNQRG